MPDISTVFQLAGVGLLLALVYLVLKQTGREEIAQIVTLGGVILLLIMAVRLLTELFRSLETLFRF
ncbi:MAG: stage III sporulation protein AC [Firmicutes bacterium]|nr:stage III sporulation protein AC [Bacillota bacterium]